WRRRSWRTCRSPLVSRESLWTAYRVARVRTIHVPGGPLAARRDYADVGAPELPDLARAARPGVDAEGRAGQSEVDPVGVDARLERGQLAGDRLRHPVDAEARRCDADRADEVGEDREDLDARQLADRGDDLPRDGGRLEPRDVVDLPQLREVRQAREDERQVAVAAAQHHLGEGPARRHQVELAVLDGQAHPLRR